MTKSSENVSEQLASLKENCKKQLIELLTTSDTNLFDLIDPLLSDSQCQIHSIFILNTLLKCYQFDYRSYDVKRLHNDDVEILSEALLLTLIKCKQIDEFGMFMGHKALEHFGGYLDTKTKESKFIAQIKNSFNSKSVEFIRKIATKNVKRILDACAASIPNTKTRLKILPCYASVYAMMAYIKEQRLPIVVALKRIELKGSPSPVKYKLNSMDIFYYKWNGVKFQCYENLDDCTMNEPSLTFESYSLYNIDSSIETYNYQKYCEKSKFPSDSFFIDCDIGHLIMASLSSHYQLSDHKKLTINPGYDSEHDFIHSIYKTSSTECRKEFYSVECQFDSNSTNVYEQYLAHLSLAKDMNCMDSRYVQFCKCKATRRIQNAFFGVRHVHVSNYLKEYSKKLCLNTDVELEQIEIFPDVNRDAVVLTILKKLGMTGQRVPFESLKKN